MKDVQRLSLLEHGKDSLHLYIRSQIIQSVNPLLL